MVLGGIAGVAVYAFYDFQGDLQEPIPEVDREEEGGPFTVLLVGSDSREGLTAEERESLGADVIDETGQEIVGERADTLILGHIDPETNKVMMVQFPRDLYVPIADAGKDKINEALESGKGNLVRTVEDLTGIEINHYAQVNIAGFKDIVDAIGGVTLCITQPVPFDPQTGIEVTQEELPVVEFDGERALRFVRSRNYPEGDLQRIQNQQKFMSAAISKVTSVGTLLNLGSIRRLMRAAGENLRIDEGTTVPRLYDIGQRFRSFDPENYEAYTVPNKGPVENEAGWVILPDNRAMQLMFEALADNSSPSEADGIPNVDPSEVRVSVVNGGSSAGAASGAAEALQAATEVEGSMIRVVEVGNVARPDVTAPVVRYNPTRTGSEDKASYLAAAIRNSEMEEGGLPRGVDVRVILGNEEPNIRRLVQIRPIEIPPPAAEPAECR